MFHRDWSVSEHNNNKNNHGLPFSYVLCLIRIQRLVLQLNFSQSDLYQFAPLHWSVDQMQFGKELFWYQLLLFAFGWFRSGAIGTVHLAIKLSFADFNDTIQFVTHIVSGKSHRDQLPQYSMSSNVGDNLIHNWHICCVCCSFKLVDTANFDIIKLGF